MTSLKTIRITDKTPIKASLAMMKDLAPADIHMLNVGPLYVEKYPTDSDRSHIYVVPTKQDIPSGYIYVGDTNWEPINTEPSSVRGNPTYYQMHEDGLTLLQDFEGCELQAYVDCCGVWTIGHGHTGSDVYKGKRISKHDAELLLQKDVEWVERNVKQLVTADISLKEFSALCCFVFNIGVGAFSDSTMLKLLNKRDYAGASAQFLRWNKGVIEGEVREIAGLTRRRLAEQSLFDSIV